MPSSSPPRKESIASYTPSSGQKRFNPFMKDNNLGKKQDDSSESTPRKASTSPMHKKPLTPTKDHPLMDIEYRKERKSEFMSDSDEEISVDAKPEIVDSCDLHSNVINNISPELENYQATSFSAKNAEDQTNNNTNSQTDIDNEAENEKLVTEKVASRAKSPMRINNNSNAKNNNRQSNQISRDRSQSRLDDSLTKSTEGETCKWFPSSIINF